MSWLFIEPTDVWLFRDGKPFDAGSDHRARSLFPANPSTIQGALRSKLLLASGAPLPDFALGQSAAGDQRSHAVSQTIGWPGETPRFTLRGPFVARRQWDDKGNEHYERFFPVPANVVKLKGSDDYVVLAPLEKPPFLANWPQDGLLPLWARTNHVLTEAKGWMSEPGLHVSLTSKSNTPLAVKVHHDDYLFARESRFGVGLDSQVKRPQEGLLYQVEFVRPRWEVGLLVEVDDSQLTTPIQWPDDGLLSMGGESRSATYKLLANYTPPVSQPPQVSSDGKTRLIAYFATPAWLNGGWSAANWGQWLQGADLRLEAVAVQRAQPIGGAKVDTTSQAGNFQKTMQRYVPAGSVFFFEADGAVNFTGQPMTDSPDDGKIGFGQVFFGAWDYA